MFWPSHLALAQRINRALGQQSGGGQIALGSLEGAEQTPREPQLAGPLQPADAKCLTEAVLGVGKSTRRQLALSQQIPADGFVGQIALRARGVDSLQKE